ncbi:unnamed protein product [Symbiodinium natans]|uniref:Uncharacterized protein n=1 Tax=Symbiodinium natans TaxID=878477 RepID=A0A812ILY7_9DINO|nr:unnamed protein product [Symbiodinium natans]
MWHHGKGNSWCGGPPPPSFHEPWFGGWEEFPEGNARRAAAAASAEMSARRMDEMERSASKRMDELERRTATLEGQVQALMLSQSPWLPPIPPPIPPGLSSTLLGQGMPANAAGKGPCPGGADPTGTGQQAQSQPMPKSRPGSVGQMNRLQTQPPQTASPPQTAPQQTAPQQTAPQQTAPQLTAQRQPQRQPQELPPGTSPEERRAGPVRQPVTPPKATQPTTTRRRGREEEEDDKSDERAELPPMRYDAPFPGEAPRRPPRSLGPEQQDQARPAERATDWKTTRDSQDASGIVQAVHGRGWDTDEDYYQDHRGKRQKTSRHRH